MIGNALIIVELFQQIIVYNSGTKYHMECDKLRIPGIKIIDWKINRVNLTYLK